VEGVARNEFPFSIWYTYPQLLLKNAPPRPGPFFDRHGGSILDQRQQPVLKIVEDLSADAVGRRIRLATSAPRSLSPSPFTLRS